jgi:HEAT repeat protein/lysophospholipase L1-like esterase
MRSRFGRLAANLALAAATTLVVGGVLEALARRFETPRPKKEVAEYLWDWEEEWERDFYTVGSNASGWPPEQEWNADGLRDRAHPKQKLPADWRVAFLGDSVTLGAGIEAHEAYPQVLEADLAAAGQDVEVMNVGLWGWSTRQERLAFERLVKPYRPDQVVLAVCLNDLAELQNNLARPPRWLTWLHERSALVRRVVNAEGREIGRVEELFEEPDAARSREALSLFFEEVRTLRREVEAEGASFDVVVFPFRFQVEANAPAPVVQERIAAFCAGERLRCLDLLPAMSAEGPAAFVDYDHLSVSGARLVARALRPLVPERPRRAIAEPRFEDADPASRREAARQATGRTSVPALFAALGDPSEAVRFAAAQALYRVGTTADDVAPLAAALQADDSYVRSFAAYSLGRLGEPAAAVLPALIAAYRREELEGRGAAVVALAALGPRSAPAVPALVEGLKNPKNHRRWTTARALGRVGPGASAAVPALIDALRDPNNHVRMYVAQALGRIGVEAAAAVPALQEATRDQDAAVVREAQGALRRIRGLPAAH